VHAALDVRRFTALDMYGTAGTRRRRRIILTEFVVGCPAVLLLAVAILRAGNLVFGAYALGVGLNYLPLALHGIDLFRPGRLETELAGVDDVRRQLMRAGLAQFLLFVPFLVASVAAVQLLTHRARLRRVQE
jgi:hypothetical protein